MRVRRWSVGVGQPIAGGGYFKQRSWKIWLAYWEECLRPCTTASWHKTQNSLIESTFTNSIITFENVIQSHKQQEGENIEGSVQKQID